MIAWKYSPRRARADKPAQTVTADAPRRARLMTLAGFKARPAPVRTDCPLCASVRKKNVGKNEAGMLHNECFAYAAIFLGGEDESLQTNRLEIVSCVATTPRCARVRNTDLQEEKEVFRIPFAFPLFHLRLSKRKFETFGFITRDCSARNILPRRRELDALLSDIRKERGNHPHKSDWARRRE